MQQATDATEWDQALRALEHDLAQAERLLADDDAAEPEGQSWAPPIGLGPIPAHLQERARALLDRQLAVARRLSAAAGDSRRHERALSQLGQDAPRPPVYLDTPA